MRAEGFELRQIPAAADYGHQDQHPLIGRTRPRHWAPDSVSGAGVGLRAAEREVSALSGAVPDACGRPEPAGRLLGDLTAARTAALQAVCRTDAAAATALSLHLNLGRTHFELLRIADIAPDGSAIRPPTSTALHRPGYGWGGNATPQHARWMLAAALNAPRPAGEDVVGWGEFCSREPILIPTHARSIFAAHRAYGAQIVVWPETSPTGAAVLQEDETALLQRAGAVARQGGMYLDLGLAVFRSGPGTGPFARDEAVLLDPTGRVVWTYEKTHPTPADQGVFVLGDGKVPSTDSPYGRLANVICFDMDFPGMIRQAGQTGADLMLAPADDWPAIDPSHTYVSAFRAIENGFSLVRQASQGLSMATDYEGHVLAASDYATTDQQVIVAELPTRGVRTIYAAIGDVFAWLCLAGLAALTAMSIAQRRRRQVATTGAAGDEAPPLATPRTEAILDRQG